MAEETDARHCEYWNQLNCLQRHCHGACFQEIHLVLLLGFDGLCLCCQVELQEFQATLGTL
jgi:hypothetical protein